MSGDSPHLTERQRKWFDSVKATFQRDTGRTLEEWVEIARACPETRPRARQAWLKVNYGLGVNRIATILSAAFPSGAGWDQPDTLRAALWTDPASTSILEALEAAVAKLPDVTTGQRKGFTAWSRKVQFAAARPVRGGHAVAGFAVAPDSDPRLAPRGAEGWGDRLTGQLRLTSPHEVDATIESLLQRAWERS